VRWASSDTKALAIETGSSASTQSTSGANPISSGLSQGAKIGIGIGIPIFVILIASLAVLFWCLRRQRTRREADAKVAPATPAPPTYAAAPLMEKPELDGSNAVSTAHNPVYEVSGDTAYNQRH
jgi:hypothetical protein